MSFDLESPTIEQLMQLGADAAAKCVADTIALDKAYRRGDPINEWVAAELRSLEGTDGDSQ